MTLVVLDIGATLVTGPDRGPWSRLDGRAEEIRDGYPRDLAWVLERKEDPLARAFVRRERENIFAIHQDLAGRDFVIRVARQHL